MPPQLVQRLPWDFKTSFPEPTEQALEAGTISDEDNRPENIKAIHEAHAREALAKLQELEAVMDARRRGVDPATGKPPRTHAIREKLRRRLEWEPGRIEHAVEILMDVYADAFGDEARGAFEKAIRAWHAGIPVLAEQPQAQQLQVETKTVTGRRRRPSSALPVPRPLRSSVTAGIFGPGEDGRQVNPSPDEVREITEDFADKMIEMNESDLQAAVTKYASDFGKHAAAQLERHVRRRREVER